MKLPICLILWMVAGLAIGGCTPAIHAQLKWQRPAQGPGVLSVVNITNDYTVRDWANYHNTQCWSQDGRYTCYTRYASDGRQFGLAHAAEVHVVDLSTGQDRDTRADFVWTWDRWQVNDSEVDWKTAVQSGQALKEVHHRYYGLIARQWDKWGDLRARHDLNADGQAIRRQNVLPRAEPIAWRAQPR